MLGFVMLAFVMFVIVSFVVAEGVGFEPTKDGTALAGFQDRCIKPLCHPSRSLVLAKFP